MIGINRRLGSLRRLGFPNENEYCGGAYYGVGNDAPPVSYANLVILIIGAGAFATENARTALERGAE